MANPDRIGRLQRDHIYYPYRAYHGVIGAAGVSTSANTQSPPEQEIGALNFVGLEMNTAGDMVSMFTPVPRDLNPLHPVGVRPVFQTASATAADTITWIVLYDVIANGVALAEATTALDTPVGQETVTGTAEALEVGDAFRGVINGGTFTEAQITGWAFVAWRIEMDAKAAGLTEDIIFLGLGLDYVPKRYQGMPHHYNPAYADF